MIWYQEVISESGEIHGYVQLLRPPSWNLFLGKLSLGWLLVKSWPNAKWDLGIKFVSFCFKTCLWMGSYFVLKTSLNHWCHWNLQTHHPRNSLVWRSPWRLDSSAGWQILYMCDMICAKHFGTMTSYHQFIYQGTPLVPGLEMPWYPAEACKSWAKGCCLYITGGSKEVAGASWYYKVVQCASLRYGVKLTSSPTPQVQRWCYRHHPDGFQRNSTAWYGRYDT